MLPTASLSTAYGGGIVMGPFAIFQMRPDTSSNHAMSRRANNGEPPAQQNRARFCLARNKRSIVSEQLGSTHELPCERIRRQAYPWRSHSHEPYDKHQ